MNALVKVMSRGCSHIRQAVAHAVQTGHLILHTCEHLVPRMEQAFAKIQAGSEQVIAGPQPTLSNGVG